MRTIKVDGKETPILASPYSIVLYEREFGDDLVEDATKLFKLFSKETINAIKIMKILYVLEQTAVLRKNPRAIFPKFDAWMLEKETVYFDDADLITEISKEVTEAFFQHAKETEEESENNE